MSDLVLPQSFPVGEYTPHGYIDNPHHSMVANRSGVIRSVPPLGFGFWRRLFKGAYGSGTRDHVNYLSLLHLAVAIDDVRLVESQDFTAASVELCSRYHSKHLISYDFTCLGVEVSCQYFLPREHTLACRIELRNGSTVDREVVFHATNIFGLWDAKWWGSNGLAGRRVADDDAALCTIWAYGDYFALGSDRTAACYKATDDQAQWQRWLRDNDLNSGDGIEMHGPGPLYNVQSYKLSLAANESTELTICLSRSTNEPWALEELRTGLRMARPLLESQLDDDEAFWSRCPVLVGDWPATWRRGWVYDYETLRMNVRRPVGMFEHPWDAMQIHSPRSVLGEAAVDMLALSYADPELAKEVLYGTFADAPMPNVPCTREDGGMNMVAADGEACGTAPSWCFPFHVINAIYAATHDDQWISDLYPYLKDYLEWWFKHRTDEAGWFHCKCDWESGQDGSKRFPAAEGGSAENVRTVDVEAAVAESLRLMARFADIADQPEDRPYWSKLAEKREKAVQAMFVDGWFRDIDCRTNEPIMLDYNDVMMLSPLTCRVATPEQVEAVRPMFQHFRDNPKHWLEWPSFFLALTEAAWAAGENQLQAENVADVADRVYARTDSHALQHVDESQPFAWRIPGCANEFWPMEDTLEPGGEAYGWGATLPLHIIRTLIGLRELDQPSDAEPGMTTEFLLAPTLPRRLLTPGRKYGMANLHFGGVEFDVHYEVLEDDALGVLIEFGTEEPGRVEVTANHKQIASGEFEHTSGQLEFKIPLNTPCRLCFTWSGA